MPNFPLVMLDNLTLSRAAGPTLFRNLSWTISDSETWAMTGPMGSGKTTLAEAIFGRHHANEGTITWPLIERLRLQGQSIAWPSEVMRIVAFKESSRLFSYEEHYYQQRFEFADEDNPLTLEDFLRAGNHASDSDVRDTATRLGIDHLRSLSFLKLSNGQVRRARIARALLWRPELLILDDPLVGLDGKGRDELNHFLGELVYKGQRILLVCQRGAIPSWVSNVLELKQGGVRFQGLRSEWQADSADESAADSIAIPGELNTLEAAPVVELQNVSVKHDGKFLLQGIDWTIRKGERWALLGPNGAGKTTLLSLICGDHPQAYANDIRLFGLQRGSGESIWDVKRRIGLVSPELHLYFSEPLSAFEVAITGFHDVLTYRPPTPEQTAAVQKHFETFELLHLQERRFSRLSTGEQRLVLLVRALVKQPELLVLDEPFQGFDSDRTRRIRNWLDRELLPAQTLIFVSHHRDELPQTITHRISLEDGRVTAKGRKTRDS